MKLKSISLNLLILASMLLLAGCGAPTPLPEPTQDPTAVASQVAATIYAELTAAVTPTLPPTATPQPSNTPMPTATLAPTQPPAAVTQAPAGLLPSPTVGRASGDAAKYLYNVPADNTEFVPNETFNIAWGFQNVGSVTWVAGYKLVWVGGERFTNVTEIPMDSTVAPGEKFEFILGAFGSEELGSHKTEWQLVNQLGMPVPGGRVYFIYVSV